MTTLLMKLWMKLLGIKFGEDFRTHGLFMILKKRSADITIGKAFTVKSAPFSNLLGLFQRTIIVARKNARISIGHHVGISGVTIYGSDITIGNYVAIGANTKIMDYDFHSLDYMERRTDDQTNVVTKPVVIEDDVFIGCNCIITKGSVIGARSVVGAGSVVAGKFPSDVIIAGNPARIIRRIDGKGDRESLNGEQF